jgi:glycosyltransferase involved in cell wall biosynthesis
MTTNAPESHRLAGVAHVNLARGYRGGERQTELLVRALAARGWRQTLVARAGEPLGERVADVSGLVVRSSSGGTVAAVRSIGRPALVHVHEGRSLRAAWLSSLSVRRPYLVTRRVQKGPRVHWLNRRMYRGASRVVALSEAIAASLRRLDPTLAVEIVPSAHSGLPYDGQEAAKLRERWGGDFVVGHVGALDDGHKGQSLIVDAAAGLAESHPGMRFVIVGDGRDGPRLRESARGLAAVRFEGRVENVGDYLAAFDVFLFPSRHEGLGSILLDALYFGLPVIATRVGGIPEVVEDGVNGSLVTPGDPGAIRAALVELAGAPDRVARMAAANRERAAGFSAAVMADRYEAIYRSILNEKNRGA